MDFDDFLDFMPVILVVGYVMFMIGLIAGNPTKLENGCIVKGDKVYCEVSNIGKGE